MAIKFPLFYIAATYEDFFGEWAQVFFFTAVFTLSLRFVFIKSKFRVFFVVLALASFYTLMEEISWGQRIFNITPSEFFVKHNLQKETNIHNFITGPYATPIKSSIEYLLFTGLIIYGLIYPFALKKRLHFAQWIESRGLPSPPLYLWPYFVLSAMLELGILSFNEAEIAEILIPFALSIFLLHYLFSYKTGISSFSDSQRRIDSSGSRKLAIAICGIFFFVVVASAGATYASYSSPRLKEDMNRRLLSGIETFAGRYKHYEIWKTAIYLYKKIDYMEPDRPSIQRKLSYCYGKIGRTNREDYYMKRALEIDLKKLEKMPASISTNLSIALTYQLIKDFEKEKYHLDLALDIALERVKNKPGSASAAYWLDRTYEQRDDAKSALTYQEKTFKMKPF